MFGLGMPELLVILGIAFLIFGAKRLPDIGKSLGSAIRNFRKSVSSKEEPGEIENKEEKKKEEE